MATWHYHCDEVNLSHEKMVELNEDGFLELFINPLQATKVDSLASEVLTEFASEDALKERNITISFLLVAGLLASIFFSTVFWFVVGAITSILLLLIIRSASSQDIIDIGFKHKRFFERVRNIDGWIFHIEEGKENLVDEIDEVNEVKKVKVNKKGGVDRKSLNYLISEVKYKKYWYGLNEKDAFRRLIKIFTYIGYTVELVKASNLKDVDLILNGEIAVRKNIKKNKVRGPELLNFWDSWKDTYKKGIYLSISGFHKPICENYVVGKPIFLYELDDFIKMLEGETQDLDKLNILELERKGIEKAKNVKKSSEFQNESFAEKVETKTNPQGIFPPPDLLDRYKNAVKTPDGSLRIIIPETYRNEDKSIKYVDIEGETFTRKELNTLGAIKKKEGREIYVTNLNFEREDESERYVSLTGIDRIAKARKSLKFERDIKATDFLSDDDVVRNNEIGSSRTDSFIKNLEKTVKKYRSEKGTIATDFLSDEEDEFEDFNRTYSSKNYKNEEVKKENNGLRATDFLSD